MYASSSNSTDPIDKLEEVFLAKDLKATRETLYEGFRAIGELTSVITQLVYEEERRRKEFQEILMMTKGVLESSKSKCCKVCQDNKIDKVLAPNLNRLVKELISLEGLVKGSDIREMKEIIEDLANW
jgi:hypothetical protein